MQIVYDLGILNIYTVKSAQIILQTLRTVITFFSIAWLFESKSLELPNLASINLQSHITYNV